MNTAHTIVCATSNIALLVALLATGLPAAAEESRLPRPEGRYVTPAATTSAKPSTGIVDEKKGSRHNTPKATDTEAQNEPDRPPYETYDGAENAPR